MSRDKSSRDLAITLSLIGVFLMILAFFSLNNEDTQERSTELGVQTKAKANALVNQHLREVYDRQQMEQKNVENMNALTAPALKDTKEVQPVYNFDQLPLDFNADSANEILGKDLRLYATQEVLRSSLNDQIQKEILDDLKKTADEITYKKALAQSIIERARQQGYSLRVDENYKVESLKKITKKELPSVFDTNTLPNK